jgi:hypothetical protein
LGLYLLGCSMSRVISLFFSSSPCFLVNRSISLHRQNGFRMKFSQELQGD